MRVVIQRVKSASVSVDGEKVSEIRAGLLIYLGISVNDTAGSVEKTVNKILNLRIFDDADGVPNLSLSEINGEVLLVSQFTLYADIQHGRRPGYSYAAPSEQALPVYNAFLESMKSKTSVKTGVFGAYMHVESVNDGPYTLVYEV